MEAEVVENMGITPSLKISQLRWRELFRIAPLVFFLRQRSAKRLERFDDLVCKLIQLGRRAVSHNREKPTKARHLHLLHDRSTHWTEIGKSNRKICLVHALSQPKWSLHRGVKSITAGLRCKRRKR